MFETIKSFFSRSAPPVVPEEKSIDIGQIIQLLMSGGSVGDDFESRARNGYMLNGAVYRSIRMIVNGMMSAKPELFRATSSGDLEQIEDPNHSIVRLLSRPNPDYSYSKWIERVGSYLLIAGRSAVYRLVDADDILGLWSLRPDWMTPDLSSKKEVVGWWYRKGQEGERRFEKYEILMLTLFNPIDEMEGLSPIQPGALSINQGNLSRSWNEALLKNQGRPSGLLKTTEWLDDVRKEQLRSEWKKKYAGPDNAGEVPILAGDIDYMNLGLTPADMDWLLGQQQADRSSAIAIGAPPQAIGDTASQTFANYQEARKALYQEESIPLLTWIIDEINHWLFGGNSAVEQYSDLVIVPNIEDVDALQEDRNKQWERVGNSEVLTINEKRAALGYQAFSDPRGDRVVLGNGTIMEPDGSIVRSSRQESDDESSTDDGRDKSLDREMPAFSKREHKGAFAVTKENRVDYAKAFDKRRERFFGRMESLSKRVFEGEGVAVVRAVRKAGSVTRAESVALREVGKGTNWKELIEAIYNEVAPEFAKEVIDDGIKSFDLRLVDETENVWFVKQVEDFDGDVADSVRRYLQVEAGKKISGIVERTREILSKEIETGVEAGESIPKIADRIASKYDEFAGYRATRIARTEVIAASNFGSLEGAKLAAGDADLKFRKEWISEIDSVTRGTDPADFASHERLDGTVVDSDQPFVDPRSGSKMDFPGDVSRGAKAGDVINCRCTLAYISED